MTKSEIVKNVVGYIGQVLQDTTKEVDGAESLAVSGRFPFLICQNHFEIERVSCKRNNSQQRERKDGSQICSPRG